MEKKKQITMQNEEAVLAATKQFQDKIAELLGPGITLDISISNADINGLDKVYLLSEQYQYKVTIYDKSFLPFK